MFICDEVFISQMEYIENTPFKIKGQVIILSQHTFTLCGKTVFQLFLYFLFSTVSGIVVSHE